VEAEQESIPYLTLRARTEHRVVVVLAPPRGCRVPRLPACLPARAGSPRGPGARKEGRKLAAPAAAPWGVWDGEEVGDAAGLPVSTRVAPRYFL